MDFWCNEEEILLIDNLGKLTYPEISKLMVETGYDRSADAIRKKVRRMKNAEEILEKDDSKLDQLICTSKTKILNEYTDMLKEICKNTKPKKINIDKLASKPKAESIVLMLSDLHIGKVVKNHRSEVLFNTEIALKYLKNIKENIFKVISHARKGTNIDEIVVLLIGDIVDNEAIYDSQPHHIDSFVSEQVKNATKVLWEMIVDLSKIKGIKMTRVVTVRGNHGRTTFGHEDSNWDTIIYQNLEYICHISGLKNIHIDAQYAEYNIAEVKGHKILLRHNAPITADTPSAKAKLAGWVDIHGVDAICSGHFHHWAVNTWNDRPIFRNGSLSGSDDLAERIAANNKPAQLLFGVSKKRLPTFIYTLNFEV